MQASERGTVRMAFGQCRGNGRKVGMGTLLKVALLHAATRHVDSSSPSRPVHLLIKPRKKANAKKKENFFLPFERIGWTWM